MIPPKKHHTMIYLKNFGVFIVGGNNLDTFYFDLVQKTIIEWGKLNFLRTDPALELIQNKLYCIDTINSTNSKYPYTIEVTDLSSNNGQWILIIPRITNIVKDRMFTQNLFGVCRSLDNNIIFLGGILNKHNKKINFMYNINKNTIELSNVKYIGFKLKEKAFYNFNSKYDFILTDFPMNSPQLAFFNKKKEKIDLINFYPKNNSINTTLI
jgi:hypothetical protein